MAFSHLTTPRPCRNRARQLSQPPCRGSQPAKSTSQPQAASRGGRDGGRREPQSNNAVSRWVSAPSRSRAGCGTARRWHDSGCVFDAHVPQVLCSVPHVSHRPLPVQIPHQMLRLLGRDAELAPVQLWHDHVVAQLREPRGLRVDLIRHAPAVPAAGAVSSAAWQRRRCAPQTS